MIYFILILNCQLQLNYLLRRTTPSKRGYDHKSFNYQQLKKRIFDFVDKLRAHF